MGQNCWDGLWNGISIWMVWNRHDEYLHVPRGSTLNEWTVLCRGARSMCEWIVRYSGNCAKSKTIVIHRWHSIRVKFLVQSVMLGTRIKSVRQLNASVCILTCAEYEYFGRFAFFFFCSSHFIIIIQQSLATKWLLLFSTAPFRRAIHPFIHWRKVWR